MIRQQGWILFGYMALGWLCSAQGSIASSAGDCLTNSLEKSLYCRGSRAISNALNNLSKSTKPLVIMRGLEIVPLKTEARDNDTLELQDVNDDDDSFLGRVSAYLRTHELNLKFSELLDDETEQYLARHLAARNDIDGSSGYGAKLGSHMDGAEEARKKDKGQGIILAMALMFGKMMAVLGLGGIGAMALKALGVAMTALMMAGLIGLKSLAQQGNESSHSVSYVTAEGHHHKRRRRRYASSQVLSSTAPEVVPTAIATHAPIQDTFDPLPLVYSGWQK